MSINNLIENIKELNPLVEDNIIQSYSSPEEEYNRLKYGAGIFYNPEVSVLQINGSDSLDLVHRLSSNNIKSLEDKRSAQTLFLNEKGRLLDFTILIRDADQNLLLCTKSYENKLKMWLDKYTIADDVEVTNHPNKIVLQMFGMQSESFLTMALPENVSFEENRLNKLRLGNIEFLMIKTAINDVNVFYLILDSNQTADFISLLLDNKSAYDAGMVGSIAFNSFRIYKKLPLSTNEINLNFNPYDICLEKYVDFQKGCYIGQEVVARLDAYSKVKKRLFKIAFEEDDESINSRMVVYNKEGVECGVITSVGKSFKLNRIMALAILDKEEVKGSLFVRTNNKNIEVLVKS